MKLERHIYGSKKGYRTLAASRGVNADECRQLEHLSIGRGFTPEFLESLAKCPAWVILTVGGRRVLARVGLGPPDEYGRPTLEQFSLLVEKGDWDARLYGDIRPLIQCPHVWRSRPGRLEAVDLPSLPAAPPTLSPRRAARLLELITALENADSRGEQFLVSEAACGLKDYRNLWLVLPHGVRDRHTGVFRCFGAVSASIACVASQASGQSGAAGLPGAKLSPYAKALSDAGLAAGILPLELIADYDLFGASDPARKAVPRRTRPVLNRNVTCHTTK